MHELGIENCRPGGTPNRVVSERHELVVEEWTRTKTPERHCHAALPIRVEQRLRAVHLVQVQNWLTRRRWKLQLLGLPPERHPRVDHRLGGWALVQTDRDRTRVTILDRNAC